MLLVHDFFALANFSFKSFVNFIELKNGEIQLIFVI